MISGGAKSWHIILADLALILFVLALTALAETTPQKTDDRPARNAGAKLQLDPAQALFRPVKGGPSLAQWLARQPADPRATLTIRAQYRAGRMGQAWENARRLAREAEASGRAIRIVITGGDTDAIYAVLGYDEPR